MLSMKERDRPTHDASNCLVAVYKGQKVAVYMVEKTEISLTRQDLIDLVNVCSFQAYLLFIILAVSISFRTKLTWIENLSYSVFSGSFIDACFLDSGNAVFRCFVHFHASASFCHILCLQLKELNHDNIKPFVGACVESGNICYLMQCCSRGTIQVSPH